MKFFDETTKIPNRIWQLPAGPMLKRPGIQYVCDAAGPLLDGRKLPKHLNQASIRKWTAESNGKKHLTSVKVT